MFTRRRWLAAASTAVAAPGLLKAAAKPLLELGLVADAQYADVEAKGTRHYRESISKLSTAVAHFNERPLAFCVHLGDLIDRQWRSFAEIKAPLAGSRHAFFHVLGNHDFDVQEEEKARVAEEVGLKSRYHAFDREGFRFVFLDTTDVSSYAHAAGSPEHAAGVAELERLQAAGVPQAKAWNSGLGERQMSWLTEQCGDAAAKRLKVIAFAHHPVAPAGGHNAWNSAEVLKLMAKHRNVVAWINGHNHAGAYAEVDGVHCLTMQGMVETADTTAFATAALHADRLVLTGHGREPARELVFRVS
jgi:predicted phosphodiesterase